MSRAELTLEELREFARRARAAQEAIDRIVARLRAEDAARASQTSDGDTTKRAGDDVERTDAEAKQS